MEKQGVLADENEEPKEKKAQDDKSKGCGEDTLSKMADQAKDSSKTQK